MSSITRDQVLQMPLSEIFAAIKNPETSAQMQNLMRDRAVAARVSELMLARQQEQEEAERRVDAQISRVIPPSTEALAEEARTMAAQATLPVSEEPKTEQAAPQTPASPASYQAEDEAWKSQGVIVTRDADGKIIRMVQEYQVRDEDGAPIGRPTHLEATNPWELLSKQRIAHESATRAFHRLKKQKISFKQEQRTVMTPEQIKAAAEAILAEKDPAKAEEVVRAAIEAQYAQREKELQEKHEYETGREISNEFMRRHLHDYNPCEANQKMIGDYFAQHRLEFTLDNLEAAFLDLMDQGKLVKVPKPYKKEPVVYAPNTYTSTATVAPAGSGAPATAEPAVVNLSVTAQPQATASQPAVEATATTPAAAPNVQPAARRPGVNGGIVPGTMSANRVGPVDPALARREFMKTLKAMDAKTMQAKLKNDPQFVKQCRSFGIQV